MDSILISSRLPIEQLFKHEIGFIQEYMDFFSASFDMYQVVHSSSLVLASKISFLIHMLRPTMLKDGYVANYRKLCSNLRQVLTRCQSEKLPSGQLSILEHSMTQTDLDQMSQPEMVQVNYTLENRLIYMEQQPASSTEPVPLSYFIIL